ncbi:TPA: hypothetical protein ACX6NQ_003703 [Photobacterium damselae]
MSKMHLLRFLLKHDLSFINNADYIITSSDLSRVEYREIFNNLKGKNNLINYKTFSLGNDDLIFKLNFKVIFKALKLSYKMKHKSLYDFMIYSAYISYVINTINTLPEMNSDINVKNLICFMPLYGVENILSQYVKLHNTNSKVKMYQHAMFQNDIELKEIDKIIFNIENYKYVDDLLVWGECTYNEMKIYLDDKVKLAGSLLPVYINKGREKTDNILLILSSDRYHDMNIKLLSAFSGYAKGSIFVKKHPTSTNDLLKYDCFIYLDSNVTINDAINLSSCKFAISVNSTAYYDIYRYGVKCYKIEGDGVRKLKSISEGDTIDSDRVINVNNLNSDIDNNSLKEFYNEIDNY